MTIWSTANLGPVKSWVADAANELGNLFGIKTIGGVRQDPIPDHPSGHAIDLMTTTGTALAEYAKDNATRLGVKYIVWNRRIWSVARAKEGWRPYTGTTNPHTDHVHITFNDDPPPVGSGIVNTAGSLGNQALGGLFNFDDLLGKLRGTSITLIGAALGVALIGAGLIVATRNLSGKNVVQKLIQ